MNADYRLLTLSDVEPAAQVISQAFVDDPFRCPYSSLCFLRSIPLDEIQ